MNTQPGISLQRVVKITVVIFSLVFIALIISLYWPQMRYDDQYFSQLSTYAARIAQEQKQALGLPAQSNIQQICYSSYEGIQLPLPFTTSDDGTFVCAIIDDSTQELSQSLNKTDFEAYSAKVRSIFTREKFISDDVLHPYEDSDLQNSAGSTEVLRGSYPNSAGDTCYSSLTYYSANENMQYSGHNNPALEYYLNCTKPAKDVPPHFKHVDSYQRH